MNSAVTAAAPAKIGRSGGWILRQSCMGVAVIAVRADFTAGSRFDAATGGVSRRRSCSGGLDNSSMKAGPVQLAQTASIHARAPGVIQARAGGQAPSAVLLPVPAQVPAPRHADALLRGAAPNRASERHVPPVLQQSAPARAFCIPQNDREQKPWWKLPIPMRQPMSVLPLVRHPAEFSSHARGLANDLADALRERRSAFSLRALHPCDLSDR